ncbi:MAG: hypothetical protein Q9165_002422 [Trypethelium subeluteriae]
MGRPADAQRLGRQNPQKRKASTERHALPSPLPTEDTTNTATVENATPSLSPTSQATRLSIPSTWQSALQELSAEGSNQVLNWPFDEYTMSQMPHQGPPVPGVGDLSSSFIGREYTPSEAPNYLSKTMQATPSSPWEGRDGPGGEFDPTEQLSKLHLDLHKCLAAMRVLETESQSIHQHKTTEPSSAVKSIEEAFCATERFIEILNKFPKHDGESMESISGKQPQESPLGAPRPPFHTRARSLYTRFSQTRPTRAYNMSDSFDTDASPIDSATDLMAGSCYIRLLRIFETIASLLSSFSRGSSQSINALVKVDIRIGDFSPKPARKLKMGLLTQTTTYMLVSMSQAVRDALGSEPLFGQAVDDICQRERKLRESLAELLDKSFLPT